MNINRMAQFYCMQASKSSRFINEHPTLEQGATCGSFFTKEIGQNPALSQFTKVGNLLLPGQDST
jgi:hypothetical protein